MRISAKGRYALSAMTVLAQEQADQPTTILSISNKLDISKIYLEQVFSLLKRSGLVLSSKGSQGGYQLARPAADISALDILSATELTLLEPTELTTNDKLLTVEKVMQTHIFSPLDQAITKTLSAIKLDYLVNELSLMNQDDNFMFYI